MKETESATQSLGILFLNKKFSSWIIFFSEPFTQNSVNIICSTNKVGDARHPKILFTQNVLHSEQIAKIEQKDKDEWVGFCWNYHHL